ncbi:FAD binding domain-containing protein [Streptomyces sp. 4N509B]|uniref:FAD binding domain-containing protein n=1 Tax=Streptomyces sp. 4N509B TaxID=3457413 RepID=UPI003FD4246C
MHAATFSYHRARDIPDALTALEDGSDPAILAGGLSLVPALTARTRRSDLVIDISALPGMSELRREEGGTPLLTAGAMVRQADALTTAGEDPAHRMLAAALATVGTPSTRARGTLVGLLTQADPALQLAPVCSLLDVTLTVCGPRERRRVLAARDLFGGRARLHRELVTEARFPGCAPGEGWAFLRAGRREVGAHLGGVAVRLTLGPDRRCRGVRLAPFVRGHDGSELTSVADVLVGRPVDERSAAEAAEATADQVTTADDVLATANYRRHLVRVLSRRALLAAAARATPTPDAPTRP